jgi:hypothetical protein
VPVVSMSKKEFDRVEVLLGVQSGRLRVADACELLGLKRRQVFRLLAGLKHGGAASLVSKRRGRPSNNRLPEAYRDLALSLVRERYADFGPTLAAEKLAELHGCTISRETLRGWMIAAGLWIDRRHRLPSPHQPRRRRDCFGELVQIDGSEHAWFEDRAEKCTLLAFVDDATSRLMHLRFVASESAFDYFRATRTYLETHGKPIAFYSDKHSIFRVNAKDAAGGDGATQFGRSLTELNIDILCANSPQAKGRVERAFGTLQDRLVKELRLAGISTVEAANAWLSGFVEDYNKRFARAPANAKDLHRPDGGRRSRRDPGLARGADGHPQSHTALRPDDAVAGPDAVRARARGQEGRGGELSGRALCRATRRCRAAVPGFRQDPGGSARRDRREQAAGRGTGVRARAAGVVSAEASTGRSTTPAAAKQPRGTGPPNNLEAPGMPSKGRTPRRGGVAAPA